MLCAIFDRIVRVHKRICTAVAKIDIQAGTNTVYTSEAASIFQGLVVNNCILGEPCNALLSCAKMR